MTSSSKRRATSQNGPDPFDEIDANGVSSMHEVDGVDIPAGGSAELKPGSYHVMLIGLQRDLKEGDLVTVTLTFQNGGQIAVEAPVKTP
jgi:copper(I)-binding protein